MPKKTSRAARSQQNTKRAASARPLVNTAASVDDDFENDDELEDEGPVGLLPEVPEDKVETIAQRESMLKATTSTAPIEVEKAAPSRAGRALPRRFTNPANPKQTAISRGQEYSFIRSDLIIVTILTVLMIVLLIVLALFLAR